MSDAHRKPPMNATESETRRMHENSLHGNRETLETPSSSHAGRSGKAYCRTPDMHVSRQSDGPIVPKKRASNAGQTTPFVELSAAESVEGRGPAKGNALRALLGPDTVLGYRGIGSLGVRVAAGRRTRRATDRHYPR
jgi:hypothetical protein